MKIGDDVRSALPQSRDTRLPIGLTLLSAAVATVMVSPILWLVLRAIEVRLDRAVSLVLSRTTLNVFLNSVALVAAVTILSVLVGVPLAYLTVRTDMPHKRFWSVMVSLPLVIPSYIGAFAFVSLFGARTGNVLGFPVPSIYGYGGTVLVLTLYTYPYVYITTRASLMTFDTTLVDAARTLDQGGWRAFSRVTAPHILPAVGAGALLVALYTLSDFGTPAIMRFDAFTRVIYSEFNAFGRDYAALLSLQLLALTLVILAIESRIRTERSLHSGGGRSRKKELGRWRWAAVGVCAGVSLFALAVPIAILLLWLFRDSPMYASSLGFQWGYALNSVLVAAAAAFAATLAALPIAYLSSRHKSRLSGILERLTYVGYATPGVVLGLAIVFLGVSYFRPLYQTLPLLVFAYVVRFLPQAVGSTRGSLLQIDPQLTEAAHSLGKSGFDAFKDVTLRLIAPGVLGGAALVFLTTMKELPATLILAPSGFETLVTHIWSVQSQGYYGYAAIPALILVLISGVSMLVILSQEGYDVK